MASGKTHATVTLIATLPAAVAVGHRRGVDAGIAAAIGCLAGLVLTPDLDLLEAQMPAWKEVLAVMVYLVLAGLIGWRLR